MLEGFSSLNGSVMPNTDIFLIKNTDPALFLQHRAGNTAPDGRQKGRRSC